MIPTKSEKWDGIRKLARVVRSSAASARVPNPDMSYAYELTAIEAELRRRVEPLLEAAEKYWEETMGPKELDDALEKELDTWK